MKKTLLLAALTLTWSVCTYAQDARGPHHRPMGPLMRALDADTNGVLSAVEIANAPAALMTLDINSDGIISDEELRPQPPADAPAGAPPNAPDGNRPRFVPPLLAALDADKDGALSAEEVANAPTSLTKLDTNADGQITGDELRPARPGGPGRGPGRGGPGGPPPGEQ